MQAARIPDPRHLDRITLDELARASAESLAQRYRAGRLPASMHALDGPLVGRMLTVRGLDRTTPRSLVARLAAASAFPWAGKSFQASSDARGRGINRIRVPGLLGRQDLFPFETFVGASAIDGAPAIVLDYDLPENPPYIRRIHDEVREVAPALFLGPAMWKSARGRTTVLWFALDAGET